MSARYPCALTMRSRCRAGHAGRAGTLLFRHGTSLIVQRTLLVRKRTLLVRLTTSLIRQGTTLIRQGTSVTRQGTSLIRQGTSRIRQGTTLIRHRTSPIRQGVTPEDLAIKCGRELVAEFLPAAATRSAQCETCAMGTEPPSHAAGYGIARRAY